MEAQKATTHLLIIPYPAPSHITPLLELTRRLLNHPNNNLTATVLITPTYLHLLEPLVSTFSPSQLQPLIVSPPDYNADHIPQPITCKIRALHALYDPIVSWCGSHTSPPRVIISDFLCFFSHKVSSYLKVPLVIFYSSGAFGSAVMYSLWRLAPNNPVNDPNFEVRLDDVDGAPVVKWSELHLFRSGKPGDPDWDFYRSDLLSNLSSWGAVFNTFSELEKVYIDHFKKEMGHDRVWAIGPLLADNVAQTQSGRTQFEEVTTWLDGKIDCSVVFICFGSRTSLNNEESAVLRAAVEHSKVHFIWCVGELHGEKEGMDINLDKNGIIIKGWVPQLDILGHRAVGGFVTHCGWNSINEAIWSGVVMVAWPMGAEQYSNAKLVVDQLKLGFRVKRDRLRGVPDLEELAQLLVECVSMTRLERGRVMSLGKLAKSTARSGGRSASDFDRFAECLNEL